MHSMSIRSDFLIFSNILRLPVSLSFSSNINWVSDGISNDFRLDKMAGPISGCDLHKPLLQLVQWYWSPWTDRVPNDERSDRLARQTLQTGHRHRIRSRIALRHARGLYLDSFLKILSGPLQVGRVFREWSTSPESLRIIMKDWNYWNNDCRIPLWCGQKTTISCSWRKILKRSINCDPAAI